VPFLVTVHYKEEFEPLIRPYIEKSPYEVKVLTDREMILIQDDKAKRIRV